jgi:cyclic pyranopterin phosphate synthase
MSGGFSHIGEDGAARMVDVGRKDPTSRTARAQAVVELSPETYDLLVGKALPKGDALETAKIAGILASKKTHHLIPLCHPLPLSFVGVEFETLDETTSIRVVAEARCDGKTGVEIEAMMAAQVAALTIYDMCKAVQKDIVISDCRLLYKSGGKSGEFRAPDEP